MFNDVLQHSGSVYSCVYRMQQEYSVHHEASIAIIRNQEIVRAIFGFLATSIAQNPYIQGQITDR